MNTPFDTRAVDLGDITINVSAEGPNAVRRRPPREGSARWQSYQSLLERSAPRWHIYAPDLRGHGASSWTPGRYRSPTTQPM